MDATTLEKIETIIWLRGIHKGLNDDVLFRLVCYLPSLCAFQTELANAIEQLVREILGNGD